MRANPHFSQISYNDLLEGSVTVVGLFPSSRVLTQSFAVNCSKLRDLG